MRRVREIRVTTWLRERGEWMQKGIERGSWECAELAERERERDRERERIYRFKTLTVNQGIQLIFYN